MSSLARLIELARQRARDSGDERRMASTENMISHLDNMLRGRVIGPTTYVENLFAPMRHRRGVLPVWDTSHIRIAVIGYRRLVESRLFPGWVMDALDRARIRYPEGFVEADELFRDLSRWRLVQIERTDKRLRNKWEAHRTRMRDARLIKKQASHALPRVLLDETFNYLYAEPINDVEREYADATI